MSTSTISKVLTADYIFLGLSVVTDIIGVYNCIAHQPIMLTLLTTGGATVGLFWGLLTAVILFVVILDFRSI